MTTRPLLIIVSIALCVSRLPAQVQPTPSCRADSAMRFLDFWVGRWRVVDSTGAVLGSSHIERILDGCAVIENWTEPDGSEGKSLFYYVPAAHQWRQVWVTPHALVPGGMKEKHQIALFPDGGIRFQGEIIGPRGAIILDRTTLSPRPHGQVRQVIETSRDGGNTWTVGFDAIYQPLPAS